MEWQISKEDMEDIMVSFEICRFNLVPFTKKTKIMQNSCLK